MPMLVAPLEVLVVVGFNDDKREGACMPLGCL